MTKDEFRSKSYEDTKTGCWLWHGKAPYGPTRKAWKAFSGKVIMVAKWKKLIEDEDLDGIACMRCMAKTPKTCTCLPPAENE
jgi:hypothetical protein